MNKLINLIDEYGKLEKELGRQIGKNEILLFGETEEVSFLRSKRTDLYCEVMQEILRISKEFKKYEK